MTETSRRSESCDLVADAAKFTTQLIAYGQFAKRNNRRWQPTIVSHVEDSNRELRLFGLPAGCLGQVALEGETTTPVCSITDCRFYVAPTEATEVEPTPEAVGDQLTVPADAS